jgi:hypothetical protein
MANIDSTFGQFNDPFYAGLRKRYTDYYYPQVDDQAGRARDKMIFGLTRKGILNSDAGAEELARLNTEAQRQRDAVTSGGQSFADKAKGDVESARNDLVNQLNLSADPAAAASSAIARASVLNAAPAFSPLGDLFGDLTNLYATNAIARARAGGGGTSLFTTGPSARIVS